MYQEHNIVKLPDTDAAGILFFGNYIKLAHHTYESFMDQIGFGLNYIISEADILILIVHTDADYKKSLRLGDKYSILLNIDKIGQTSYTLSYEFLNSSKEVVASVQTVHVAVDKKSNKPIKLPEALSGKLKEHQ